MTLNLKDGGVAGKETEMRTAQHEDWGRVRQIDAIKKLMLDEAEGIGSVVLCVGREVKKQRRLREAETKQGAGQMQGGDKRWIIALKMDCSTRLNLIRTF